MQDGELLVVDPDNREEAAAAGLMTVVVNTHSDICSVRKVSGVGISMAQVTMLPSSHIFTVHPSTTPLYWCVEVCHATPCGPQQAQAHLSSLAVQSCAQQSTFRLW